MNPKTDRLIAIRNIIKENALENQEELLVILKSKGFEVTQATLSRDMKQLKTSKIPDAEGNYIYTLPQENNYTISSQNNFNETKPFTNESFHFQPIVSSNNECNPINDKNIPQIVSKISTST